MKKHLFFNITIALISIIGIILFFKKMEKEAFTPGLRRIYRPYIRHGRVYATKMYNSFSSKTRLLLRKYGII